MNQNEKVAVVFPAFVTEFIGSETAELQLLGADVSGYLERATPICGKEICSFDIRGESFVQDELMIQYITYIYSCAVSDVLRKFQIRGDFVSGYSMGIYAALYHSGSLSFTEGLNTIRLAFGAIQQSMPAGEYTMGLTGGLELHDVTNLLEKTAANTHIINSNNRHTFVYSGPREEIGNLIHAAREEGALMTRVMNVSIPYHSPYLENASRLFSDLLMSISIKAPELLLISSLTQQALRNETEIKKELVNNLFHPFRWFQTIQFFLDQQTNTIIECGAGEGLTKINKFISGEYKTVNLKTLRKFLTA